MTFADRLVLALATAFLASGICAWIGFGPGLGVAVVAGAMLAVAVGWGEGLRGPAAVGLAATGLLISAVIAAMFFYDDPTGPGRQWLGLPRATALLVYGVWPLGILPGALYVLLFDRTVLPEDRLRAFLDRWGRRR